MAGTLVRNIKTGEKGVTVTDRFGTCTPDEISVVYEGTSSSLGTHYQDLKVIGPENAQADLKKCGASTEDCCVFLVVGAEGPECERFGSLRWDIIFKKDKMRAIREPTALYPECQLER